MELCQEKVPTLCYSIPSFEKLITTWERLAKHSARLNPFIKVGLAKAEEYYAKMDRSSAYLVAMGMWQLVLSPQF